MLTGLAFAMALFTQGTTAPDLVPAIEVINPAPVLATASTGDVVDSAANAKSERVACREEVKANSRFTRRVCRKARDWERTAQNSQADLMHIQLRGNSQAGEGPNSGP